MRTQAELADAEIKRDRLKAQRLQVAREIMATMPGHYRTTDPIYRRAVVGVSRMYLKELEAFRLVVEARHYKGPSR